MRELELLRRGAMAPAPAALGPALDAEDLTDLEEAPDDELAAKEEETLDQATAARTIEELKAEISTLNRLEASRRSWGWFTMSVVLPSHGASGRTRSRPRRRGSRLRAVASRSKWRCFHEPQ